MKITFIIAALSMLAAGCSTDGKFRRQNIETDDCEDIDGVTPTVVRYGNGKITVRTRSEIKKNTEWRFILKPYSNLGGVEAYGDSTVTIDGKAAGDLVLNPVGTTLVPYVLPGPPPANDNWLSASGDYNSAKTDRKGRRYIPVCVPADVQVGQDWYYTVSIDNVGEVDPRGRVER